MRYAFLIALREYAENAKTKGFWVGIFMFPFIIGIAIVAAGLLARANPTRHFVLVDQSGAFAGAIDAALEQSHQQNVLDALNQYVQEHLRTEYRGRPDLAGIPAEAGPGVADPSAVERFIEAGGQQAFLERVRPLLEDDAPAFTEPPRRFLRLDSPSDVDAGASIASLAQDLRPYLNGERLLELEGGARVRPFAAVLIAPNALQELLAAGRDPAEVPKTAAAPIQYWSTNLTDGALPRLLRDALDEEVRSRLYVERGVDPVTVRQIDQTRIRMSAFDPGKEAGRETVSIADRIVRNSPLAFVYLLWVSIFTVMQMLLNNTIEEKSNRVIEVLLSSVTPSELMMGKLMGIAAIGTTMVATWLATAFLAIRLYQGAGAESLSQALDVLAGSGLIPVFLLCFLLGYLLYAGIFPSIGSLCNELKDAQSLQGPMMIIMLVPLLTMTFINRDPHGALATVMTWIPLYTPFVMMNRAAADPPLLDLVGATALMIVTTGLVLWLSGRIFRIGILRMGQRPKLIEVVRWLRGAGEV
jgi:ABC-2 type transport system permease protein